MFDYIFCGTGISSILLANKILNSSLKDSKILLIDRALKTTNDRSLGFWEIGSGEYDYLLSKDWQRIQFQNFSKSKNYKLKNYTYKYIKSIDFYNEFFAKIKNYPNIKFVQENVLEVIDNADFAFVKTNKNEYKAKFVFDSRFNINLINKNKFNVVNQYVFGQFIKTKTPAFDSSSMHFFDLNINQNNSFQFIYFLPFSSTEALVELISYKNESLESSLNDYISNVLKVKSYKVTGHEAGVNVLTDYNFSRKLRNHVLAIGCAGGLLKSSTGMGFKRMIIDSDLIVRGLLSSDNPFAFLKKPSLLYSFADSLMLYMYKFNPELGYKAFSGLFLKNNIEDIFKFLDEKASIFQLVKIFLSIMPLYFIKNGVNRFLRRL